MASSEGGGDGEEENSVSGEVGGEEGTLESGEEAVVDMAAVGVLFRLSSSGRCMARAADRMRLMDETVRRRSIR
jgi:hypothetical protein